MAKAGTGRVNTLHPGFHTPPVSSASWAFRPTGAWMGHPFAEISPSAHWQHPRPYRTAKLEWGFEHTALEKQNTLSRKPRMNFYKQRHLCGRDLSLRADRRDVLPNPRVWASLHPRRALSAPWGLRPLYLLQGGPWATSLASPGSSLKMQNPTWTC